MAAMCSLIPFDEPLRPQRVPNQAQQDRRNSAMREAGDLQESLALDRFVAKVIFSDREYLRSHDRQLRDVAASPDLTPSIPFAGCRRAATRVLLSIGSLRPLEVAPGE